MRFEKLGRDQTTQELMDYVEDFGKLLKGFNLCTDGISNTLNVCMFILIT